MAELLDRVTQDGLESPKLFACTRAAFACMGGLDACQVPSVCAAHLLKTLAFSGLRPSLDSCAACGGPVASADVAGDVYVSFREGGVVCAACRTQVDATFPLPPPLPYRYSPLWPGCASLLGATFAEVVESGMGLDSAFSVLRSARSGCAPLAPTSPSSPP